MAGTDADREGRTAGICGVKVEKIPQVLMRMLAETAKVGDRSGEVVEVAANSRTTELDKNIHHFLVESLLRSMQ